MFGMLLGTLQRFKSDSAQKSEKVVGALYFVHKISSCKFYIIIVVVPIPVLPHYYANFCPSVLESLLGHRCRVGF